ncbi:hypothetical protein K435DRAFT_655195, partial [Dendrothele bispora CBS 962.96]
LSNSLQFVSKGVRTRVYHADRATPSSVIINYRENRAQPGRRYLLVLDAFSGARTQPYVHDVIVSVIYRRKPYKFRIFFKRHMLLPKNRAIRELTGVDIEGDVVVAAVGKKVDIRNLRGGIETKAADYAVVR